MVSLPDGERKSLYGMTRSEVVARMRGVHEGLAKGIMPAKDGRLLRDYLERWLEGVKLSVEFTTWHRYRNHVRCLSRYLGSRRLSKLSVDDLRSMDTNLLEEGYAAQTIHVLRSILHHVLQDAMAEGLVGRNVAELVKPPRAQPVEMQPLTRDEARTLLEGSRDDRFHALWVVAITTGMRIGELLALEWGDIDIARSHLTVNRSAYFKQGLGMLIKAPKTKRSRRVIRLNANVVAELKAHRARQNQERLAAGAIWLDRGIVFCNEVGGYTYHSSVLRRFRRILKSCGLPRIRLHDLRHTAATLMLASGVNIKVVSEMLGHSSVATTLTIYAHVTEDMQEHAARAMGQIFFE
jgi:integrase